MQSEIVSPDAAPDLSYALTEVPKGIAAITHEPIKHRGLAVMEEFLTLVLDGATASAVAALGKEQAIEMLELQAVAAERSDLFSNLRSAKPVRVTMAASLRKCACAAHQGPTVAGSPHWK